MTKKILFACFALLAVATSLASAKPSKKSKNADDSATKEALRTATEDFVRIEAGTFMMGIDHYLYEDYEPVHSVTLTRDYYMCDHEVTNAEYKAVMGKPSHRLSKGDDLPAVYVSWDKAIDYCNTLSELKGLTPCYTKEKGKVTCDFSANGYRLPTEAEWERAARAGDDSTEVRVWSGVTENPDWDRSTMENTLGEYVWLEYNSGNEMHPVKEKKPNAWGLYDMIGNAWEWCWDWEASISGGESVTDPTGPAVGSGPWGPKRVVRGGAAWDCGPNQSVAYRRGDKPMETHPFRGFRVVRTADD
ncbi:MAG: SUMF1/EgtB/PvdO family nonheme iron enzyme [Treponema sp.]|nr:SUMF1/EgtB/PvdO family nonheme iron enzyme [Treponema sp.]